MEKIHAEIVVIGGGAAGMAAALTAARNGAEVLLLERLPRVGKKILLTGNGRCNLGNLHCTDERYHGSFAAAAQLCSDFDVQKFFEELGLYCRLDDEGRLYPHSNHAASVLDALRFGCERYGVQVRCDCRVTQIERREGGFKLICPDFVVTSEKVILAVGGAAAPNCGTDGSAFKLAESLGLKVITPRPALVSLRTSPEAVRALKGLRVQAEASLYNSEKCLKRVKGEVQFADAALSGICIFDLARWVTDDSAELTVSLNLLPEYSPNEVSALLAELMITRNSCLIEDWLTGLLPKRIAQVILRQCNIDFTERLLKLKSEQTSRIAALLIDWRFPIYGCGSWQSAQVTAGGIDGSEVTACLESKQIPGFYVAGEALDVDGDCGGFNLQWAWASGYLAGLTASGKGTQDDTH